MVGLTLCNIKAQNNPNSGVLLYPNYQNPIPEIIGNWVLENDSSFKITFDQNNIYKEFINNVEVEQNIYYITHSCGLNSDENFYFLRLIDEDGDSYCYEVNGVNANNSGILSLTSMDNGKIIIYNKE